MKMAKDGKKRKKCFGGVVKVKVEKKSRFNQALSENVKA